MPSAALPAIDLDRQDGQPQQGVYRIVRGELHLTLANPNLKRPVGDSVEKAGGVACARYIFQRAPTTAGLEVLRKQHDQIISSSDGQ